jgi:hypothetical protein
MTGRNQSFMQVAFQCKPTMIDSDSNAHIRSFIYCPATRIACMLEAELVSVAVDEISRG